MGFTERLHLFTVKWNQIRGFVTTNQNLVEDGTRDTQAQIHFLKHRTGRARASWTQPFACYTGGRYLTLPPLKLNRVSCLFSKHL